MVAAPPRWHKRTLGLLLGLALWLTCAASAAAAPRLALVVVGPGDSPYTLYGHAGVILFPEGDGALDSARLFNFGITDFKRPHYIADFLEGQVAFWGHERALTTYLKRWKRQDRTITVYPLRLTTAQTERLVDRMRLLVREDNKHYIYDTFRENCATRIRDLLDTETAGAVRATLAGQPTGRSFRDDVRAAYAGQPALLLLTEIFPGPALDRPRDAWALAYRPQALADGLARVEINGASLLMPPQVMRAREGADPLAGNPNRAKHFLGICAGALLLMALVVVGVPPRVRGVILAGLLTVDVLVSVPLLWVALTTHWPDMQGAWLPLWLTPLDIGLFWTAGRLTLLKGTGGRWARSWVWLRLIVAAVLTALSPLLDVLDGPMGARLVALAGIVLALRCIDVGTDAQGRLRRVLRWPLGKDV